MVLCSAIRFTLARNRKEFIIAGNNATIATNSTPPTIAIAAYIAPQARVPESPGNILLGYL